VLSSQKRGGSGSDPLRTGTEPNQTLYVSRQRHSHSTDHAVTLLLLLHHLLLLLLLLLLHLLHSFLSLIQFLSLSVFSLTHSPSLKLPPLFDSLPLTRRYFLSTIIFFFYDSSIHIFFLSHYLYPPIISI